MIILAHRGARAYALENTLSSFKKAIEYNIDYIELDVYKCKSGEIVVLHDKTTKRVSSSNINIEKTNFNIIQNINLKNLEKIPSLKQVLDLVNKKVKINIELKGKNTSKEVSLILKEYIKQKKYSYNDFLVSSFNYCELVKFNKLLPQVKIGVLFKYKPWFLFKLIIFSNLYSVHIDLKYITRFYIKLFHFFNLKVFVFTVNKKTIVNKLNKIKVDGIFSDYPDILK
jgi:glycerophosphoryl diester phosphodiesterase